MIQALDLFSGIGGFSLGLKVVGGFQTVAFCENEPFCQAVLREHFPDVPIIPDIRKLTGESLAGLGQIDMVCGGPPCQPASVAGKRKGETDDRWLWPDFLRVVRETKPVWVLAENPRGIVSLKPRGLAWIVGELEAAGYETSVHLVGACHVGAPHRRERVWIVAHAEQHGRRTGRGVPRDEASPQGRRSKSAGGVQLAHTNSSGLAGERVGSLSRNGDSPLRNHADRCGQLADADCAGQRAIGGEEETGRHASPGHADEQGTGGMADAASLPSGRRASEPGREEIGRIAARWPSRPGEPQRDWERPRLAQLRVGVSVDGVPAGLVQAIADRTGWADAQCEEWWRRNQVRIRSAQNKHALRAIGNAVVPRVVAEIGRAIMEVAAMCYLIRQWIPLSATCQGGSGE